MDPQHSPVDATDRSIVEILRASGRSTLGDIGERVGLTPPAVKRRIDRLERDGVVLGYTAVVDHAKLGAPLAAFVELTFVGDAPVNVIEGLSSEINEIEALHTLAGDPDALAQIRVTDVAELKRVIDQIRRTGKVTGTKTLIVLDSA